MEGFASLALCRYGVRPSRHTLPRFARQVNTFLTSVSGRRDSVAESQVLMKRSAGALGVGRVDLTFIQAPCRTEREDVLPVKTKWKPEGRFLMPLNCGVVVKERRSMPPRACGGSCKRRIAAVEELVSIFVWS